MKPLLSAGLFTFFLFAPPLAFTAETQPATAAAAQNSAASNAWAGSYVGKWAADPSEGQLRLKLKSADAVWTGECSFTLEGTEIPTKVVSVKVDGPKVEWVVQWDSQGTPSQTRLIGTLSGGKIEGTFQSKIAADVVAEGTWTATRI